MNSLTKPVITDLTALTWQKSSYSNGAGGMCVEVAHVGNGVAVRDSRNPTEAILRFSGAEWDAFLAGIRDGEFDRTGRP